MLCTCGTLKSLRFGIENREGRLVCKACNLPVAESADEMEARESRRVQSDYITTLQALPGHTITEVLGPVSVLSGSAGLTATEKGRAALSTAMRQLSDAATEMGANAVVGLIASTFGAGGGITSVFGGDAVGVLLLGTAVVVEPDDAPLPDA